MQRFIPIAVIDESKLLSDLPAGWRGDQAELVPCDILTISLVRGRTSLITFINNTKVMTLINFTS